MKNKIKQKYLFSYFVKFGDIYNTVQYLIKAHFSRVFASSLIRYYHSNLVTVLKRYWSIFINLFTFLALASFHTFQKVKTRLMLSDPDAKNTLHWNFVFFCRILREDSEHGRCGFWKCLFFKSNKISWELWKEEIMDKVFFDFSQNSFIYIAYRQIVFIFYVSLKIIHFKKSIFCVKNFQNLAK